MTQVWVMRMTGAALTIGGIALATFINTEIPDKSVWHLVAMGAAAIVSAIGIGIYEDAAVENQDLARQATDNAADSSKPFAPPHTAH